MRARDSEVGRGFSFRDLSMVGRRMEGETGAVRRARRVLTSRMDARTNDIFLRFSLFYLDLASG